MAVEELPLRRRVARLSALSLALIALAVVGVAVALWVAFRAEPKDIVGLLPLGASDDIPSVSLILAAGAAAAAFFVGLAASARRRGDARARPRPPDPAAALAGDAPRCAACC